MIPNCYQIAKITRSVSVRNNSSHSILSCLFQVASLHLLHVRAPSRWRSAELSLSVPYIPRWRASSTGSQLGEHHIPLNGFCFLSWPRRCLSHHSSNGLSNDHFDCHMVISSIQYPPLHRSLHQYVSLCPCWWSRLASYVIALNTMVLKMQAWSPGPDALRVSMLL